MCQGTGKVCSMDALTEWNYNWDKKIELSGNAVSLLLFLVKDYSPEPWEVSLCNELFTRLTTLKKEEPRVL